MSKDDIYLLRAEKPHRKVCRIDKPRKRGTYFLTKQKRRGQQEYLDQISLSGFTKLPSGLRRDGNGFASSGYLLLKHLSETLGRFGLTIDKTATSSIEGNKVVLSHDDLRTILRRMRTIKAERFRELDGAVKSFLHQSYPSRFEEPVGLTRKEYQANTLAEVLRNGQALDKLSKDDIKALTDLYPEFIRKYWAAGTDKKRLFALNDNKRVTEVVYIDHVLGEFTRRLASKSLGEQSWQDFLRDYILLFNSNYATVLEKENVALLGTKFPDFLLIDAYSYLDVYEIKRPTTNLLKLDKSHGTYYWDTELTKAISQVENYIAHVNKHAADLCDEIRKQRGLDVRVIKPRGFIIVGTRNQLQNEIMEDNFRLLNNSLKNLSIILFDELLDNLKNFLSKLKRD
jgi:hypothetical protein